jgi:hypothetical protein
VCCLITRLFKLRDVFSGLSNSSGPAKATSLMISTVLHTPPARQPRYLRIFHHDSPETYTNISQIPTNSEKTSFYVPQVKQFYVVHPKTDVDIARLLVYRVNP